MKAVLSVAAAIGLCAATSVGQSIEFRILERFDDTFVGPGDAAATASPNVIGDANDKTLWFVVQARMSGLEPAEVAGIAAVAGSIVLSDSVGRGRFKAAGSAGFPAGSATNNSPVSYYPPGTSDYGFGTSGVAVYAPFRLISNLGPQFDGSVVGSVHSRMTSIVCATGAAELDRQVSGEVPQTVWGVDAWTNVFTSQFDASDFRTATLTFQTNFNRCGYIVGRDENGIPMAQDTSSITQASYTVLLPAPSSICIVVLVGFSHQRRR
jgi:hypothetical protein